MYLFYRYFDAEVFLWKKTTIFSTDSCTYRTDITYIEQMIDARDWWVMIVDLCTRSQLFTINKSLINMLLHINRFYKKKKKEKIAARFFQQLHPSRILDSMKLLLREARRRDAYSLNVIQRNGFFKWHSINQTICKYWMLHNKDCKYKWVAYFITSSFNSLLINLPF